MGADSIGEEISMGITLLRGAGIMVDNDREPKTIGRTPVDSLLVYRVILRLGIVCGIWLAMDEACIMADAACGGASSCCLLLSRDWDNVRSEVKSGRMLGKSPGCCTETEGI